MYSVRGVWRPRAVWVEGQVGSPRGVWERVLFVALPAASPRGRLEAGSVVETLLGPSEPPGSWSPGLAQNRSCGPQILPQALHSRNANS